MEQQNAQANDVVLVNELVSILKISRKTIERLERRGAFPIPRLPKLDRFARYPRTLVEQWAAGKTSLVKRHRC